MAEEVADALGASPAPDVVWDRPRYNIAPTQDILIVRQARAADGKRAGGRELTMARWGLVPRWADDPSIGNRMINARSESAASKPAFREAFARRRCLIPASGFFEWQAPAAPRAPKRPFRIERPGSGDDDGDGRGRGGGVLTMAGLWETWSPSAHSAKDGAGPLRTTTILTTEASGPLAAIHHRMPVFLEGEAREIWLDPAATIEQLEAVVQQHGLAAALVATEISRAVNKPEHDDPLILEAAPESPGDSGFLF